MKKKTILFLGAAPTQVPPIRYAREQGHHIITCDYLPNNPGHKIADEWFNVSTTDMDVVLQLAKSKRIDGIVAYASDPAAPTAAYVAEKLGLPGNPYESVLTLQRKDLFRRFLKENQFNVPVSKSFSDTEKNIAKDWASGLKLPIFVKPVDSSGSKGVTEVKDFSLYDQAFDHALHYSRAKKVVIEEKIIKKGHQVAGDGFIVDGRLAFRCWANENFDSLCNGLVPIGQTFPTTHALELQEVAHTETQRLLDLLGMKQGALNFDFVFSDQDEFYFLELGPRNGGCKIPEVIKYATGVDLIKYTVDAALGLDCSALKPTPANGYWSSYMVHAIENGCFKEIYLSDRARRCIVEQDIYVTKGDAVKMFSGSNDTLGEMIMQFSSNSEMQEMISAMEKDIKVILE
ncbi:ATP-grasp domain-containing protein [Thiorhodovibrio frisius]|uniref:Biotin carboxylase n=1 Tax=Thiorhodovibrio frisius TaxID=631362 RepID=H8Z1X4_9GAMM|nr:ATP-grasp domain-containing protein [Thiorhodovibrio frisius]EIC22602.1 biotin carboxylase [Thiorhodovibrio frisius]WPL20043.1 carbamoyl phosphate synthase-like protein [Thiorhodovibrio frisius]